MTYGRGCDKRVDRFTEVSHNQHGSRFKYSYTDKYTTGKLSAKRNDAIGMENLILIAQMLRIPVEYDFDKQEAYIEIAATKPKGTY
jgi:hypothetical protein